MGGVGSSASKPLALVVGADQEATRGPTLRSTLVKGPEGRGWRLVLVSPLRLQVFDAHSAQPVDIEDTAATAAIQHHAPFTASCVSEDRSTSSSAPAADAESTSGEQLLAVGCQDGFVLVFSLADGNLKGPLHELQVEGGHAAASGEGEADAVQPLGLTMSVTALKISGTGLYAGACSKCRLWDLRSGELQREFQLPSGDDRPVSPGALTVVRGVHGNSEAAHVWVGLDNGSIAVFDVDTGTLVRSFSCAGSEAIMSLTYFRSGSFVFALSAHRRVSVWDAVECKFLQKYPAELITCGADLSAMAAINLPAIEGTDQADMALLLLTGVDGSICMRRVGRRSDGKLNCVLLCYSEGGSGNPGCPITAIDYHPETDTTLLGDAGCVVTLLTPLRDQLGSPGPEVARLGAGSETPSADAQAPVPVRMPQEEEAPVENPILEALEEALEAGNSPVPVETGAAGASLIPASAGS